MGGNGEKESEREASALFCSVLFCRKMLKYGTFCREMLKYATFCRETLKKALFVAKVEHTLSEKIILNEVMLRESPTICATLQVSRRFWLRRGVL